MLNKNPTLEQWAIWWMDTYIRPVAKPSGYEHYHDNLHKHILPKLGKYHLNKLTTPVVQQFLNEAAESGNLRTGGPLSPKSIKNMRVVLDVCCKRAVADGYMDANPVPATVYKHCTGKRVDIMTDEDQKVLEGWLFQSMSLQDAGIIQGLYSGMRLGLPHVKYHALRHTFATRAVEKGVDVATVSGLLGHADVTTTTHYYVHPREEAMRRAMSGISPVSASFPFRSIQIPFSGLSTQTAEYPHPVRECHRRKVV